MNVQTQQATNARVQATVQQQLAQFEAAMRARELTFRRTMDERQDKAEQQQIAFIVETTRVVEVNMQEFRERLDQLERPWWKQLLGRPA